MNILFLSKLSGKKGCGPYYSIPNQVAAQAKYDNVFWYNLNDVESDYWKEIANVHNLREYPIISLNELPKPFNNPDIIVVEEQYNFFENKIIKEARKRNIPYVLVPRCSLTKNAQKIKKVKKWLGNFFYFKKLMRNAIGIQYLTEDEKEASGKEWNKNSFVIPNGITMPHTNKKFHNNSYNLTFIGRIAIHHKGLDILVAACVEKKELLIKKNIIINIYGDGEEKELALLKNMISESGLSNIIKFHGPVYDEKKISILLDTDVFVLTSRFEGLPMGLLEALSYGIPVLITKGTNITGVVDEYNAGWTSDDECDGVADSLEKMIDDLNILNKISKNCIKLAEKYSWNEIAKQTHVYFNDITNTNRKGM